MKVSSELKGMIGLEIHTYLVTKQKLFCECRASRERGTKPNIYICPICTGQPGAKPFLPNKSAVNEAIQIGIMLGCKINEKIHWQRKHYDWPDLPKGYQTTMSGSYSIPLGEKGKFKGIRISSMHLEEDPAAWDPVSGGIDYNRSGLPLVEIVTAPDFKDAEEVIDWLNALVHNMAYLKVVDSNAGIKVDVNVSIPKKTERVEIKNLNSLESIGRAINYEIERQKKEGSVRETRRFDEKEGVTVRMRGKEEAEDYRFIPDPDLQIISFKGDFVKKLEKSIPESPELKLKKLIKEYSIDEQNAKILSKHIEVVEFFEKVSMKIDGKFALGWINIELLRLLNDNKTTLDKIEIEPEHFIDLLKLIKEKKITELQGKQILKKFYPKSFMPSDIEGKITNEKEIEVFVKEAINKNSKAVEDFKNGEKKAFDFLLGEIMKASNKRADYKVARNVLEKLLN